MASGTGALASSGASFAHLANITSSLLRLPPSLQTYLDTTVSQLSSAAAGATGYLESATGLSPTTLYSTLGGDVLLGAIAAVISKARPAGRRQGGRSQGRKMRRYGWSSGHGREQLSPFNSSLGHDGTVPSVTEQDYEYITSEDLQNQGLDSEHAYAYEPRSRPPPDPALEIPSDDVLLLRRGKEIIKEFFPAYSIGDGKLLVGDVRERVQLVLKLSDSQTRRIKLLYKGKILKDDNEPVCKYGVKNNSEIMVILPESSVDGDSDSGEEIVVVGTENGGRQAKTRRQKSSGKKNYRSPRDSGSNVGLDVPRDRDDRRQGSTSRGKSPASGVSGTSASSAAASGPIAKLNSISETFRDKYLSACLDFTRNPPENPAERKTKHGTLALTVEQQVLSKLDAVDANNEERVKARRKELVNEVLNVLKGMDEALHR